MIKEHSVLLHEALIHSNFIENEYSNKAQVAALSSWNYITRVHATLELTMIRELHYRIMDSFMPAGHIAGDFRNETVVVGGRACVIVSLRLLEEELFEWVLRANKATTYEEVIANHIAFEKIHPFIDGNGRVGRMLMNWKLVELGISPVLISPYRETQGDFVVSQKDYYQWFRK